VGDKLQTKFRPTEHQANELISKLISVSLLKDDVGEISSPLRDPDDNRILSRSRVPLRVPRHTGDDDLLELKSFSGVEIVSVRAFAERLRLKID
jgi:predicted nucleic acid-binding protein